MAGVKGQERTDQRTVKYKIRQIATRSDTGGQIKRERSQGRGWRFSPQGKILPDLDGVKRNTSPRGKSNSLFPCHTASVGFGAKPQEGSRGVSPAHDFTE